MTPGKERRLGRGLEALLSPLPTRLEGAGASTTRAGLPQRGENGVPSPLRMIPLAIIRPNPFQPRKDFGPAELSDLESSLRVNGLLQPVTVRTASNGSGFELIAGERRLRAARNLGWTEIPAIVKEAEDRLLLSLAMVENLQRTDLNPIEEAEGYQQLISDFSLTQQEVADIVGKDRSTVANTLRLLALPASVRRLVWDGQLTIGHARALLGLGEESHIAELARDVVAQGLSVREVERRVREAAKGRSGRPGRMRVVATDSRSAEVRDLEDRLRKHLGTDARIVQSGKDRGEVRVPFYSADDFDRLLDLLLGASRSA